MSIRAPLDAAAHAYRHNHLARNSGYVILSTGVAGVLGTAYWALGAHLLPVDTIGTTSALIAAMTFASTFATMGLGTTTLRVLPNADDTLWSAAVNALIFAGLGLGLLFGGILVAVLPVISPRLDAALSPTTTVVLVGGTAMMTLSNLLDSVFQAERAAQYVLLRGATFGALKLVTLIVLTLAISRTGEWVLVSWVLSIAATSAYSVARQLKGLGRAHRYSLGGVGPYLRSRTSMLLLHHLTTFSGFLVPSVMPTLVVARLSSAANAKFYIAWLLSSILLTISGAVSGNLLSDASYTVGELRMKTRFAIKMIALLLVPAMLIILLLGHPLLEIFGRTYAQSAYGILIIFVVVAIPDAITNVYVTVLLVQHRRRTAAVMNLCMAAITLGGAWALMPRLGPSGAAWAWAAGQAAGTVFVFVDVTRTNIYRGAHRKAKAARSRQSVPRGDREAQLHPTTARYATIAC